MHHLGEAKAAKRCIVSLCQLWMLHYYDKIDISSEASLTSLTFQPINLNALAFLSFDWCEAKCIQDRDTLINCNHPSSQG
jgi:hypothetical protein